MTEQQKHKISFDSIMPSVLVVLIAILGAAVGLAFGTIFTIKEQQRQAVEAGVGWYEADEETGRLEFKYGCRKCREQNETTKKKNP